MKTILTVLALTLTLGTPVWAGKLDTIENADKQGAKLGGFWARIPIRPRSSASVTSVLPLMEPPSMLCWVGLLTLSLA
jgi:hypothetical protein